MSSNSAHINSEQSEQNVERESLDNAALEEEIVLVETQSTSTETQETPIHRIDLPQPDAENITVLTDKLPNKPILLWNRYDSPWEGTEEAEMEEKTDESAQETLTNDSDDLKTENPNTDNQKSQGQMTNDQ